MTSSAPILRPQPLNEVSLGRFVHEHIPKGYIAISACRGISTIFGAPQGTPEQLVELKKINKDQTARLRQELSSRGFTFFPAFGEFMEEVKLPDTGVIHKERVTEASFLVIPKQEARDNPAQVVRSLMALGQELCKTYNQMSFLYKPPGDKIQAYYINRRGHVDQGFNGMRINDRREPYSTSLNQGGTDDFSGKADRRLSYTTNVDDLGYRETGAVLAAQEKKRADKAAGVLALTEGDADYPTHFYGLPRPKGFTLEDVTQALSLARRDQPVQIITYYPIQGKATRQASINTQLLQVLLSQGGLEHQSSDMLEESIMDVPPLAAKDAGTGENRIRYDYFNFTPYGKDIIEYYHLQLLASADNPQVVHEGHGVRFTKTHLLSSIEDVDGDDSMLSEYNASGFDNSSALESVATRLSRTWGNVSTSFRTQYSPTEIRLPGIGPERLDFGFQLDGAEPVAVNGSLYSIQHEDSVVWYLKALAKGAHEVKLARLLETGETIDEALGEMIEDARTA